MGLLRRIAGLPLLPVTGVLWVAQQVERVAESELAARRREELLEPRGHAEDESGGHRG